MKEFLKVVHFTEALNMVKTNFPGARQQLIDIKAAYNRVLSQEVLSKENLPAFNRSTIDGYAVIAEDTFGSSESLPSFLNQSGEVIMGEKSQVELKPGQCWWIPTGGMLPPGANAAVMVEHTEKIGEDTVLVYKPVGPFENVMKEGEEVARGQKILGPGKVLGPQDIGMLASLGINQILVNQPYKIGLISTGDEVIPVDQIPRPGQIRDVNTYTLAAAVQSCGGIPTPFPIVEDSFAMLKETVEKALIECDAVILSGGSSVGIKDMAVDVLLSFPDSELLFHGIAVKPGKPTLAARIGKKIVIGLPGHPVSALMMFFIICRPALWPKPLPSVPAQLSINIASQAGRDDFVPVRLIKNGETFLAQPLFCIIAAKYAVFKAIFVFYQEGGIGISNYIVFMIFFIINNILNHSA